MRLSLLKTLCLVLGLLSTGAAYSAEASTAKQVVETFQTELIDVMKQGKSLGYTGRYQKLYEAVTKSHDLNKIVRIVVGKEWEKLTETQQQTLIDTFSKFSVASYAHNFKEYAGESFVFDSEEQTARGGIVIHARFKIPDEKDVKFDYMLKEKGDSWQIINVIANGVSDLALKQTEYSNILQQQGFDALIAKINEKIDNYSKL